MPFVEVIRPPIKIQGKPVHEEPCPKCGGPLESKRIPCPDGFIDCEDVHFAWVCKAFSCGKEWLTSEEGLSWNG